jgi:L,D-peptidoglycan transpeptidase YkuD (ErfK/YbiS/YcfS/YnhG family)
MAGALTAASGARAQSAGDVIEVRGRPGATTGVLRFGGGTLPCALGRAGIVASKREGDGGTPAGVFPLRRVFWRPDREIAPSTELPASALTPQDGWCDDPKDPAYNTRVQLPVSASHEDMWRADGLYDLLAVIGYNDDPPIPGAGSAIFLHVAGREAGKPAPTAGCVALALPDLRAVLAFAGPQTRLDIALI